MDLDPRCGSCLIPQAICSGLPIHLSPSCPGTPRRCKRTTQQPSSGGVAPGASVNDTDPAISYAGTGWAYYPGRPASFGDLNNDVHATTSNGEWVSYTFTGASISYVSEKSDGYGLVDVYVDDQFQQTVDANAAGVHHQGGQVLFSKTGLSAGQHSIKLVKKSGVYMLLDAFVVQP